jgi:lysine 2,3-aminomutase
VNDRSEILKDLFHKLLLCRVRPYYLYQCDLITGSAHLRTTIREGQEIMEQLRGYTTGYAVPTYVVDGPGGGGKIPIGPGYIVGMADDRVILKNYKGDVYEYPEISQTQVADLRG